MGLASHGQGTAPVIRVIGLVDRQKRVGAGRDLADSYTEDDWRGRDPEHAESRTVPLMDASGSQGRYVSVETDDGGLLMHPSTPGGTVLQGSGSLWIAVI